MNFSALKQADSSSQRFATFRWCTILSQPTAAVFFLTSSLSLLPLADILSSLLHLRPGLRPPRQTTYDVRRLRDAVTWGPGRGEDDLGDTQTRVVGSPAVLVSSVQARPASHRHPVVDGTPVVMTLHWTPVVMTPHWTPVVMTPHWTPVVMTLTHDNDTGESRTQPKKTTSCVEGIRLRPRVPIDVPTRVVGSLLQNTVCTKAIIDGTTLIPDVSICSFLV